MFYVYICMSICIYIYIYIYICIYIHTHIMFAGPRDGERDLQNSADQNGKAEAGNADINKKQK